MADKKQYALILGISSGFGQAVARELAAKGINIYGVHMDTGTGKKRAEEIRDSLLAMGVEVKFFNTNAVIPYCSSFFFFFFCLRELKKDP